MNRRSPSDVSPSTVYELPGDRIASLDDFWVAIGEAINGPGGYFGKNLDAFIDCLRGGFGTPEAGTYAIRWLSSEQSRATLGYPETARQLKIRLARCHPRNRPQVSAELEDAEHERGPTVFDWLVDIINLEPSAKLELR
jgi:hypothetical protein